MQHCLSFAAQFCITTKESEFQLFAKLCVDGQKNCISKQLFMLWSSSILVNHGKRLPTTNAHNWKSCLFTYLKKNIKSQKYCKSRKYLTWSNKCFCFGVCLAFISTHLLAVLLAVALGTTRIANWLRPSSLYGFLTFVDFFL